MTPRPVWITGAGGLIGNYLLRTADRALWAVLPLTRKTVDLEDFPAVERKFRQDQPGAVIHCAALSRSPICESQPELAFRSNVLVTRELARLASEIPLVFFSTDLVFDGLKGNYQETDRTNPLSVYARTKLEAEKCVAENPRHTILRTSLNAGISPAGDRGFNEELRRSWREGKVSRLFEDEFRCPIPAEVTARATWEILEQEAAGLFHLAGTERLSRFQMGQLIAEKHPEEKPRIEAASLKVYQGAPRPPDTSMNLSKIQAHLSFPLPRFSAWARSAPAEAL